MRKETVVLFLFLVLATGCTRPVVKQPAPHPVTRPPLTVPQQGGPIEERDVQAVQEELKTIYFDYDQYALTPEAQAALQFNADLLKRAPQVKVVAEGHCDERGTAEYNLALGERRARAAMDFLINLGIAPGRLSTVSYGSELPIHPGHNEEAWAQNRRVYFRISK